MFTRTFDLIESDIELAHLFTAGDQVLAVGRTRGTSRTTGQPFDAAIVHVLTVRDGRITAFDAFVEEAPISAAIHGDQALP
ncbi:nuclear transport factor 2 family protein [Streptomyces sp. NPDC007251]|uniref:nuclear transport factor 2 family protein n=1 Tax=unclassified Streptomyces TaxID=2593676 RepID=UPI0033E1C12C